MAEYVIGDLHFCDPNIINFERPEFASVVEMNEFMMKCWNDTVDEEDTVFVIGDFFDCAHSTEADRNIILNNLKGNIVLVVGNHDRPYLHWYHWYDIEVVEYPIVKDEFWILSHEPMYVTESAPYANIFAHVHRNPMYTDVSSRSFCASAERIGYTPVLLSEIKKKVVSWKNN